jgi:hypothetical protein
MDWRERESMTRAHADRLRRSAKEADLALLKIMASELDKGWP